MLRASGLEMSYVDPSSAEFMLVRLSSNPQLLNAAKQGNYRELIRLITSAGLISHKRSPILRRTMAQAFAKNKEAIASYVSSLVSMKSSRDVAEDPAFAQAIAADLKSVLNATQQPLAVNQTAEDSGYWVMNFVVVFRVVAVASAALAVAVAVVFATLVAGVDPMNGGAVRLTPYSAEVAGLANQVSRLSGAPEVSAMASKYLLLRDCKLILDAAFDAGLHSLSRPERSQLARGMAQSIGRVVGVE